MTKLWSKAKLGGLGIILASFLVAATSLYSIGNSTLMWLLGVSTRGEITSTHLMLKDDLEAPSTSSAPSNAYNVAFLSSDGVHRSFTTKFSSSFKLYDIGENVTVIYWASTPEDAKLLGFMSLYLGPFLAILFAFVFWLIGMFLFLADKPRRQYIKN